MYLFLFLGLSEAYQLRTQRCCTCRRWRKWKVMARKAIKQR